VNPQELPRRERSESGGPETEWFECVGFERARSIPDFGDLQGMSDLVAKAQPSAKEIGAYFGKRRKLLDSDSIIV